MVMMFMSDQDQICFGDIRLKREGVYINFQTSRLNPESVMTQPVQIGNQTF